MLHILAFCLDEYRNAASQNPNIPNGNDVNGSENEMTKIIAELAVSFLV